MDRLTIINDALINTGNNPVNALYDGSPEWQVADPAYRRAVSYLIPRHTWNFANTSVELAGILPSSPHAFYDRAFQLPGDCMLVEAAWIDGRPLTDFEIVDQKFCCRVRGTVRAKYVRAPLPGQWPPLFVELLTMKVEGYLLRGLNEDTSNADRRDAAVKDDLDEVRSALDRQEPARAIFRSRTATRRRGGRSLTSFNRPPYNGVP